MNAIDCVSPIGVRRVHLVIQVLRDQRATKVNKAGLVSKDVQVLQGLQGYMGGEVLQAILAHKDGGDLQGTLVSEDNVELMDSKDLL